jgi:hypothetical protein
VRRDRRARAGAPDPGPERVLRAAIGEAIAGWSGAGPPWVRTAGLGIPWLHARLDIRPKDFRHAAYRSP